MDGLLTVSLGGLFCLSVGAGAGAFCQMPLPQRQHAAWSPLVTRLTPAPSSQLPAPSSQLLAPSVAPYSIRTILVSLYVQVCTSILPLTCLLYIHIYCVPAYGAARSKHPTRRLPHPDSVRSLILKSTSNRLYCVIYQGLSVKKKKKKNCFSINYSIIRNIKS